MKRLMTLTIVAVVVLAVVAAGSALLAQEREQRQERVHRGEHMMTRLAEALELTEEQSAELSSILQEKTTGAAAGQRDAALDAKRQLQAVVGDPQADEQQVIDAARAVAAETERLALEQHRLTVRIAEVLTPEQMDKFRELMPQRMERHGRGHGRQGQFGDGA